MENEGLIIKELSQKIARNIHECLEAYPFIKLGIQYGKEEKFGGMLLQIRARINNNEKPVDIGIDKIIFDPNKL